tara:strand:+ start:303 stop:551 length:249 start_codon:yes stop_codon:yes gene_type:complete
MTKENSKIIYNLKIDDDDFNQIIRAFIVASNYIYSNSPKKPTIGKESKKAQDLRKKNFKIAMELNNAMNNILFKYPHETIKT